MYWSVGLVIAGLGILWALRLLRSRHRGWTKRRIDFVTVGYFYPLLGGSAILLGIGLQWDYGATEPTALNTALLLSFLSGLALLLASLLAVMGVPMPPILLPRWYRAARRGEAQKTQERSER